MSLFWVTLTMIHFFFRSHWITLWLQHWFWLKKGPNSFQKAGILARLSSKNKFRWSLKLVNHNDQGLWLKLSITFSTSEHKNTVPNLIITSLAFKRRFFERKIWLQCIGSDSKKKKIQFLSKNLSAKKAKGYIFLLQTAGISVVTVRLRA